MVKFFFQWFKKLYKPNPSISKSFSIIISSRLSPTLAVAECRVPSANVKWTATLKIDGMFLNKFIKNLTTLTHETKILKKHFMNHRSQQQYSFNVKESYNHCILFNTCISVDIGRLKMYSIFESKIVIFLLSLFFLRFDKNSVINNFLTVVLFLIC